MAEPLFRIDLGKSLEDQEVPGHNRWHPDIPACLNAIDYLKRCGYTNEQAYIVLGAAPIEGRISGIVDIPNVCCTLYIPTRTPREGNLAMES